MEAVLGEDRVLFLPLLFALGRFATCTFVSFAKIYREAQNIFGFDYEIPVLKQLL